jgi:hypothetical protein
MFLNVFLNVILQFLINYDPKFLSQSLISLNFNLMKVINYYLLNQIYFNILNLIKSINYLYYLKNLII